ncbi:MAG: LptE family protein [Paludibacteraceae bacterium]|nr:LptE family protein [Paludibacteraceae bacterium]
MSNKHLYSLLTIAVATFVLTACTISYKFNGTVIDYSKVKTIAITDFTNRAPMVYAPLAVRFNEKIKDTYVRQTRLELTDRNGDLELEGEITGYDITPQSMNANSLSAETRLTIRIQVRYTNNTNPDENFERSYSAYRNFDSSKLITEVQDDLIEEIVDEICNNIYNDTVANW